MRVSGSLSSNRAWGSACSPLLNEGGSFSNEDVEKSRGEGVSRRKGGEGVVKENRPMIATLQRGFRLNSKSIRVVSL